MLQKAIENSVRGKAPRHVGSSDFKALGGGMHMAWPQIEDLHVHLETSVSFRFVRLPSAGVSPPVVLERGIEDVAPSPVKVTTDPISDFGIDRDRRVACMQIQPNPQFPRRFIPWWIDDDISQVLGGWAAGRQATRSSRGVKASGATVLLNPQISVILWAWQTVSRRSRLVSGNRRERPSVSPSRWPPTRRRA